MQTSMGRAVGGGVTYLRVGGVVQASTGLAVGGGVTYSGVGGVVVQTSMGRAVGGGVTCSGVGGVVQAQAPSSWVIPPSSSSLKLDARAGAGRGRVEALAFLLVARRMMGRGPGRVEVPSLRLDSGRRGAGVGSTSRGRASGAAGVLASCCRFHHAARLAASRRSAAGPRRRWRR